MQKKISLSVLAIVSSGLMFSACSKQSETAPTRTNQPEPQLTPTPSQSNSQQKGETMKKVEDFEKISAKSATISTSKGDIVVELYPDRAPVTVASFLDLAKKKFYDGIIVHRVEPGFVIQAGDPKTKEPGMQAEWGTGGPGYTIPDEFSDDFSFDSEGILAMAKTAAPNSGGSQFFITLDAAEFLNGQYTVFGKVTSGMDVVKKIQVGDTIKTITYK